MDIESSFGFIAAVNEAFGYTHEQTLKSSLCVILSMMRERGYTINKRNKEYDKIGEDSGSSETLNPGEKWVYITDFKTGEKKRIKQVISI